MFLKHDAFTVALRLRLVEALEGRAQGHHVIGQQTGPGIACLGLNLNGFTGDVCLSSQWLELATYLARKV